MKSRQITPAELPELLRLYAFLHPEDPIIDPHADKVQEHWEKILIDEKLRYFVVEEMGQIVATCTLTLVPNLTRNLRPYWLIKNVVTDPAYRKQGFATAALKHALGEAWHESC